MQSNSQFFASGEVWNTTATIPSNRTLIDTITLNLLQIPSPSYLCVACASL
jgi:hypothetical protein